MLTWRYTSASILFRLNHVNTGYHVQINYPSGFRLLQRDRSLLPGLGRAGQDAQARGVQGRQQEVPPKLPQRLQKDLAFLLN